MFLPKWFMVLKVSFEVFFSLNQQSLLLFQYKINLISNFEKKANHIL